MTKTCRECGEDTDEPIAVALEHVASTGGRVVYLCQLCRFVLGIVPLDQHPAGSDGRVRYEEEMPA
ncbi:hypothetical protein [Streptomyces sp. MZ04]|uniref:hypothetical protein n=1 Tax=Streptomyces sp. MZ04 TaxID=2559236 RepID=UPI00107E7A19|nr:hypothetical protein [Streptomyces sp. MZ04]TGB13292.1 hypothetical protein E2651_09765 [Streptomyces sp. MZ04]